MDAQIIIYSNAVFTGLQEHPEKLAIAIKDNKIIKTGTYEEIITYKNEDTTVIDANDQLVMAGFHDTHLHLMAGVLFTEYSCDLSNAKSLKEAMKTLQEYANENAEDEWVIGTGWDHTAWGEAEFPTRQMIDEVIADRPVFLLHAEGHYAWINSLALEIANITSETENPHYGTVLKDEQNDPTGILIESAIALVGEYAYDFSDDQKRDMLQSFLDQAKKTGVTSVNDFYMSRAHEKIEGYSIYEEFDQANKLTSRIHLYPPMNGDLKMAKQFKEKYNSGKLKFTGLKQFIDGVVTGYTALMLDPYEDKKDTKGETSFSKEQLQEWVTEADKEGYQIRFHSIGDGAVRLGLDLFEKAQKENGARDARHALEHIEIIAPTDIQRFKELGVQASVQPTHLALMPRESHTERVTEDKYPYLYPNKLLFDSEAVVPYSSDYPIVELNPLLGIYHAVTRKDFTLEDTWNEQEKITLAQALKAYTKTSAYSVFREDEIGTLEEGKLADIVILDRNIFESPVKEILTTKVDKTIVDGQIVYDNKVLLNS